MIIEKNNFFNFNFHNCQLNFFILLDKLENRRDILNSLRILLMFDMSCDEGCLINLRHVAWTNISCGGIRGVSSQCSDQLSSFVFTESVFRDVIVCHGCTVPGTEATSQEACCQR